MSQLFPPRANVILGTVIAICAACAVVLPAAVWAFARAPGATGQYRTFTQPVPFSHPLHVNGLRIDCQYCHAGAMRAAFAGLPPTQACVPCHWDGMLQTSAFAAVRQSLSSGTPIPWRRVNSLPGFVFFNHAVHTRSGVTCGRCHGPVELMAQVYQAAPLTMEWCLECHRDPARYLSTTETTAAGWWMVDPARSRARAAQYDLRPLTSCTTCHR